MRNLRKYSYAPTLFRMSITGIEIRNKTEQWFQFQFPMTHLIKLMFKAQINSKAEICCTLIIERKEEMGVI